MNDIYFEPNLIKVKKIREDAVLPSYQTRFSSGFDLCACGIYYIYNDDVTPVHTGLSFEFPIEYELQIRMRSGLAKDYPNYLANGIGTIDADYRGEIICMIRNPWLAGQNIKWRWRIDHGVRIAQAILIPIVRGEIIEVETLSDTERGAGGFGSTGI